MTEIEPQLNAEEAKEEIVATTYVGDN